MGNTEDLGEKNEHIRKAIWNSMLDAELRIYYWQAKCRQYDNKDRSVQICLSAATSIVFSGWVLAFVTSTNAVGKVVGVIWKVISGVAVLGTIIHSKLGWQREIQDMSKLIAKWTQIKPQYDNLYFDYESGQDLDEICERYRRIKDEESLNLVQSPSLPYDDEELWEQCQNQILESEGLNIVKEKDNVKEQENDIDRQNQ